MKVAIINYGMGNLGSVRRAFEDIGAEACIANHPSAIYDANRVVLPGVGAFAEGMKCLSDAGWVDALHDVVTQQRKPLLGICLGMQMLASASHEGGLSAGLGFVPARFNGWIRSGANCESRMWVGMKSDIREMMRFSTEFRIRRIFILFIAMRLFPKTMST